MLLHLSNKLNSVIYWAFMKQQSHKNLVGFETKILYCLLFSEILKRLSVFAGVQNLTIIIFKKLNKQKQKFKKS